MQEPDDALFQLLGYDSATESFTPTSIFLIEPNSIVHKRLCDAGVDADLFYERVCAQPTPSAPIVNCEELFARCRAAGLHVAVLTSDDRQSTLNFLEQERVEPDALHCGDDGRGHKPSAEPLLALASVQRTPFFRRGIHSCT
jgi:phosphoglycolate phosphatase-like HAD superfamily hydrolase